MKLKYYLRGAGVGIIVATLILTVAFAFHKSEPTEDEIITRAKKLGMDFVDQQEEEQKSDDASKHQEKDEQQKVDDQQKDAANNNQESGNQDEVDANFSQDGDNKQLGDYNQQYVTFVISSGENSSVIAQHLQEAGLVDNANAFDMFISAEDMDNDLLTGTYSIPVGATFADIASILTTKQ